MLHHATRLIHYIDTTGCYGAATNAHLISLMHAPYFPATPHHASPACCVFLLPHHIMLPSHIVFFLLHHIMLPSHDVFFLASPHHASLACCVSFLVANVHSFPCLHVLYASRYITLPSRVFLLSLQPSLTNGSRVTLPSVGGLSPPRQGVPVLLRSPPQQISLQLLPRSLTFRCVCRTVGRVFSACAVCLGRHPHKVVDCTEVNLWDNSYPSCAIRSNKALTMRDGRSVCSDWQRVSGCPSSTHDFRHICSGCASPSHGAQGCPRAQKSPSSNSL